MKMTLEQIGVAACLVMKEITGKEWRHQTFCDRPGEGGAVMIDSEESVAVLFYWKDTGLWTAQLYGGEEKGTPNPSLRDAYQDLKKRIEMRIVKLNTILSSL